MCEWSTHIWWILWMESNFYCIFHPIFDPLILLIFMRFESYECLHSPLWKPVIWQDPSYGTVDGSEIRHQLRFVGHPIIYRAFYLPPNGGWHWDFWTINTRSPPKPWFTVGLSLWSSVLARPKKSNSWCSHGSKWGVWSTPQSRTWPWRWSHQPLEMCIFQAIDMSWSRE